MFCSRTSKDSHGYQKYFRSNNDGIVRKGNIGFDKRWIVPYNPWLLRKYKAHINVKIRASFKSVKYLKSTHIKFMTAQISCFKLKNRMEFLIIMRLPPISMLDTSVRLKAAGEFFRSGCKIIVTL